MIRALLQKRYKRVLFITLAILLDLIIAASSLLAIYYFNYLIPHKFATPNIAFSNILVSNDNHQTTLPGAGDTIISGESSSFGQDGLLPNKNNGGNLSGSADSSSISAELSSKFADKFSDKVISTANSYRSKDISISVTPCQLGSGKYKITYYVADVYTSNINCFRTYFAQDTYGTGYSEHLTQMSRDVHSILAMNGDSYCYNRQHTAGVLIRNGTLYRAEPATSDICVLYRNGEMKTYSPEQFDLQQAMENGAYQSWTFGPNLLDSQGKALTSFNTWDYIRKVHPRSAIGYFEPGHYCLVVVDGRQTGYSRGMTLSELAQVFENLGCSAAYNLDGGHSTFMTMGDQVVNQPYKSDHQIVDCLYFEEVQ